MIIWDKKDCILCKEHYQIVSSDPSFLIKNIHDNLEEIRKRGDISKNILNYFKVENSGKFGRFNLLPKKVYIQHS